MKIDAVGDFHTSSDEAVKILNTELKRRGLKDRVTSRMLTNYRQRGTGPEFRKAGYWVRYPGKERLIAWLDRRFSAPVRSTRELRGAA
jgi:hypothetical protein